MCVNIGPLTLISGCCISGCCMPTLVPELSEGLSCRWFILFTCSMGCPVFHVSLHHGSNGSSWNFLPQKPCFLSPPLRGCFWGSWLEAQMIPSAYFGAVYGNRVLHLLFRLLSGVHRTSQSSKLARMLLLPWSILDNSDSFGYTKTLATIQVSVFQTLKLLFIQVVLHILHSSFLFCRAFLAISRSCNFVSW